MGLEVCVCMSLTFRVVLDYLNFSPPPLSLLFLHSRWSYTYDCYSLTWSLIKEQADENDGRWLERRSSSSSSFVLTNLCARKIGTWCSVFAYINGTGLQFKLGRTIT